MLSWGRDSAGPLIRLFVWLYVLLHTRISQLILVPFLKGVLITFAAFLSIQFWEIC